MDDFRALPPVARTLTALTFIESALIHSQSLSYYFVPFVPQLLFKFRSEIWRLCTPFLLTDPKLNFVFDLYFMYTYSSRLEFGSSRFSNPGSFLVYVLFIAFVVMGHVRVGGFGALHYSRQCSCITMYLTCNISAFLLTCSDASVRGANANSVKLTAGFYLGAGVFTQALILAFAYTYSQDNKGTRTMFFVVEIPTLLLPWARLALTFVMKGWHSASIEFTGIVAAHLYDFLTRIYPTFGGGENYIVTPAFIQRWFTGSLRGGRERVYGRAYRPPNEGENASRGWTSSVRTAWDSRGSGRRLGGN